MYGIFGIIGQENISKALYKIESRGLGTTKIIQADHIAIGLNYLSINEVVENGISLFEFGDLIGAFNGTIFNVDDLLKKFNLKLRYNSDTEIILPMFEQIGSSVIQHLDGFYSGIIYNKVTKSTFLLCDYIGKNTLFLVKNKSFNFIVSELKVVDCIDTFQVVPKGFSELRNGEITIIEEHEIKHISKYKIKETLTEAIVKHIPRREKCFGVFLSGGLDSSIIASIVAKHCRNVIYYTLGDTEDMCFATKIARKLGIEAQIKQVHLPAQNELFELIEKVVYHTESYNPSIISNGVATYLLLQEASKDGLKVVLSGEGADELFCGYTISKDINKWFEKRVELIDNMHFTECRRLHMISLAHAIEIRCPFLDEKVFYASNDCTMSDLIKDFQGKQVLRKAFEEDLSKEISERGKMSFDVGSGIRKMVVEYLTQNGQTEKAVLRGIWSKYFQKSLAHNLYFHSYPTFDKSIEKRSITHKVNKIDKIEKIEKLLLKEFETIPFHNLFMLNNKNIVGSNLGGTCSDKVLHFKKVLSENCIDAKLHSAFMNKIDCHRMLSVEIDKQTYFIDVGSGWVNPKIIPAFKTIEYSTFGMMFKTEISEDNLLLFHKTKDCFKLMMVIPLRSKLESEILKDIANRFCDNRRYPFQHSLRFSKIINNSFFFIKGDTLRIYNDKGFVEKTLNKTEIKNLIEVNLKIDLQGFKNWYTPTLSPKLNIAVIIATKNRSRLLEQRSLKSVISQTLHPNSVIVVDDSDDKEKEAENIVVIEKLQKKSPEISIKYIKNRRTRGAAGSWNSAIDYLLLQKQSPENTFIAILDDDDEWNCDYLKLCSENIQSDSLDMVACDFYRITDEQKKVNQAPNQLSTTDFLIGNPGIQGSNIFIRLSCFLEAGCFDENIKSCTDRDLCVRISDLKAVKYKRVATPLMNHFAESNRIRMSTPNTETKDSGLHNFWLKHSKRMTLIEKEKYLLRAKKLFNWEFTENVVEFEKHPSIKGDTNECFTLFVGVICSSSKTILPLLTQLDQLRNRPFIDEIKVFIFENNLSKECKSNIIREMCSLETVFITKQMQDKWISTIQYFRCFSRNKNNMFSIAQARTMLQKYIGQIMEKEPNVIAWILDEDMQILNETIRGLEVLPQLKKRGIDIVIGKYEYSSPNPPINGMRTQLVDFWYNLNWLLNQDSSLKLPDISNENNLLINKYIDYYYDLSRKHYGQLEHPFWLKPISPTETVGEAIDRLCKGAINLFGGVPLTRQLLTIYSENILDSIADSVNRGGTTFIFNVDALNNVPNLSIKFNGSDIRRSDMVWAVINKYYKKMDIKSVNIPIFHAGKEIEDPSILDIDKVNEEILGSCLYAGLTDFLKLTPEHCLNFTENEISIISQNIENHLKHRMILLKQTFYRARGISKCIKGLNIFKQKQDLQKLTEVIDKVFSKTHFELIQQNVDAVSFLTLSNFLNSMQHQSDKFRDIKLL